MMRIDGAGRASAAQAGSGGRPLPEAGAPDRSRALTVLPGGRADAEAEARPGWRPRPAGRAEAGFVTQLILAADPALRPARTERTREAVALYNRAVERVG